MEARSNSAFRPIWWSKPSIICRESLSLRPVVLSDCIPSLFGPGRVRSMGLRGGSRFGPIRVLRFAALPALPKVADCHAWLWPSPIWHCTRMWPIVCLGPALPHTLTIGGISEDPTILVASYNALKQFAGAWDLLLDEQETSAWASDSHQAWVSTFHTALHCRDLGAHLQYSCRYECNSDPAALLT